MKTKRLVTDALCASIYVLLSSFVSLNLLNMKLSFDALPILVGAALFGPVDGLIIGLLGNFIAQLLGPYGLSVTTPLWMLPDGLRGLLVGLWLSRCPTLPEHKKLGLIILCSAFVVTLVNTGVMWVDSLVFSYAFAATIPSLLLRIAAAVLTSLTFTLLLPPILRAVKKTLKVTA